MAPSSRKVDLAHDQDESDPVGSKAMPKRDTLSTIQVCRLVHPNHSLGAIRAGMDKFIVAREGCIRMGSDSR